MSAPIVPTRKSQELGNTNHVAQHDQAAPVLQLKPILEAQDRHGPIFRRDLFNAAYAAYHSIDDCDPDEEIYLEDGRQSAKLRSEITLLDIYGKKRTTSVLREGHIMLVDGDRCASKRVWIYNDLQKLGTRYGEGDEELLPFQFGTRHLPIEPKDDPIRHDFEDVASEWQSKWDVSELRRNLVMFLEQHAGHTTRVDQIMCFGLGRLASQTQPRSSCRSYVQHLAACTMRYIFGRKQGGTRPKVYAQDPDYRSTDTAYLSEHFGITVLPDPEGFKALDGHTFVMTIAPNVPVRQIALDMTDESEGPAGFLCGAIHSDGLEGEGKCNSEVNEGNTIVYYTCNPSPSLWTYKQKSVWTEHDDRDNLDCFGKMGVYLKTRKTGDVTN